MNVDKIKDFLDFLNEDPELIILSLCTFLIGLFCADVYMGKVEHEKVLIVDKIYVPEERDNSYRITISPNGETTTHITSNGEREQFLLMVKNGQGKIRKLKVKAEFYYKENVGDKLWVKIGIGGISRFTYYVEPDLNFNKTDW